MLRSCLAAVYLATTLYAQTSAEPAWTRAADERGPMTADEARAFMKRLAQHAVEHHMKKADSPQRGMMYEYVWWKKQGQPGGFIQGEALDTMHDGSWFACAMANAHRATGDAYYKEVLVKWQLPFYLKMLNESDTLFDNKQVDVRDEAKDTWKNAKEWLLQGSEKGFVPYWWDDGESVSLEMLGKKSERPFFPCTNAFAGQPNPEFRLKGWSHGSSNHLAQDLAILLIQSWLLLHESPDKADQDLAAACALAAKNLQECRARHGSPNIPVVLAACGLLNGDESMLKRLESWDETQPVHFKNAFTKAVSEFKPGQKLAIPAFADDAMYTYYTGVSKHRGITWPLATKLAFDAFSIPLLWQAYSDDGPVPPGVNRFDLTSINFIDGRPEHVRSQRKGPRGGPIPIGSRFGPQNMAVCGWALQAAFIDPNMTATVAKMVEETSGKPIPNADVKKWLERELGGGLRTWEAVFNEYGYIPTGIGCQSAMPGVVWDEFSDNGGYAHLISAAAQWIQYKEGKADWSAWE
ncbi:hypothetical protein [Roseimicrobium sp. ORNL1]|uniref:hypothetical protein n=1 Tax=Roseimicrobium sp. ORNL1 TaxID=2711231 RepID=UPI0013E108C8|nr:hypothetical protein [Roseimicrobium sp. ORNL1]QIF04972.1 hypothetical protein G5S37_26820 [Roseimicrobium sp. ORNL1]